jgi:hypothetical protein
MLQRLDVLDLAIEQAERTALGGLEERRADVLLVIEALERLAARDLADIRGEAVAARRITLIHLPSMSAQVAQANQHVAFSLAPTEREGALAAIAGAAVEYEHVAIRPRRQWHGELARRGP